MVHCGFFFVRLSWTGSGLQANMIEEYVLWCVFALLLFFLSCPSCLWRPRLFVSVASRHMTCIVLDLVDDAFDSRPALCLFSVCHEEYSAALVSTTALVCLGCVAGVDAPRAMFPLTAQCLVPSGTCYASVLGWLSACSVFCVVLGSTADTCGASVYGVFHILRELVDYGS